jgi:CheY-like chemotaxis protein
MRSGSAHYDMNGDPVRLQQVISNVLSNAIKFSPEGATVELQLSREDAEAVLQVRDHGRGITPELLPHVFDRFRQSAMGERQGGLGLGLAIARHLIEVHGGTIAAASDGEGKGAVFTMRFPLRAGAGGQSFIEREHDDRASALPSLAGVHVLVVEDNIDNRDMFVAVMGRCGATVESTTSGADALLRIERKKPDVIIADIALPDMDGCAFVTRLRKNARPEVANTPTLAVTVFGLASDQERILAAGFSALRQKPIEPADLANAVARLVEA